MSDIRGELVQSWRGAGIGDGDTVLVHSSLRRCLARGLKSGATGFGSVDVLESFLEALGPNGTLLLPTFNFQFTKGVPFDLKNTPSEMGALTEAARLREGAVRTGHPIYSFVALGAGAGKFAGVENFSGYGADSPFAILRKMGGKIAVLDLPDQTSMTFYHHVEEMENVDYRYHKTFTAPYVGWDGKVQDRTFGLFVRNLEKGILTNVDPMGEELWRRGLYSGDRPRTGCGLRVISAEALFEATAEVIRAGRACGMLYSHAVPG